jgi:hypothetical protein
MIMERRRGKVEETWAIAMDGLAFGNLLAGFAAEGLEITITQHLGYGGVLIANKSGVA